MYSQGNIHEALGLIKNRLSLRSKESCWIRTSTTLNYLTLSDGTRINIDSFLSSYLIIGEFIRIQLNRDKTTCNNPLCSNPFHCITTLDMIYEPKYGVDLLNILGIDTNLDDKPTPNTLETSFSDERILELSKDIFISCLQTTLTNSSYVTGEDRQELIKKAVQDAQYLIWASKNQPFTPPYIHNLTFSTNVNSDV